MTRSEVEKADPQQCLLLEVARECVEDTGVTNWQGKTIGCYMGSFDEDWIELFAKEPHQYGIHRVVHVGDFAFFNRLSYDMELQAPRYISWAHPVINVCLQDHLTDHTLQQDSSRSLLVGVNLPQ